MVVIDQPGSGQAAVYAAAPGIARTDPDFFPLVVGNTVLGNGYSSRLNQEIRLKRGLSYGASSSMATRLDGGLLSAAAQTRNDAAAQVVDLMLAELKRIASEPVPAPKLDVRSTALVGSFARALESVDGLGGQIASLAELRAAAERVPELHAEGPRASRPRKIQDAYRRRFPPQAFSLVVVGDAKVFLPALRAKYPGVEVIPVSELNLDSASLR